MIAAQEEAVRQFTDKVAALGAGPRRVGRLVAHEGGMLEVTGFDYPIGYGGSVRAADGRRIRAEIAGFRGSRAMMVPLESDAALRSGARVEPDAQANMAVVGEALLGRVIGPMGEPLDGLGPVIAHDRWPLAGKRENVLNRGRVTKTIDLGVRAINALLTAGHGQRIAVAAGSGVGKSVLIGQIIGFAEADVIVVGLIGERGREVSDFVETKMAGPMKSRTVTVAVPADHSPILRLRAAYRATAIAEYFRKQGKKVLLIIDSLTRIAHAQREIGLALGEPPTMKGYPPSALALIPKLVERAGNDRESGGSITALYTVLADGDDLDDPIVDGARAIVDGHIILSRSMAEQGIFPAIDIGKSLSRVATDIISDEHRRAMANFRRIWSAYEENRDLLLMGAYREGTDANIDEAVARRPDLLDFIRQAPHDRVDLDASVADLMQGFGA
ncbi:MAG: FliI/YscN family ATPase [Blastomonas fulva]|jgi:flagellum-specific ATP synthase|uniref:FliI/YscN family ATPase n=1 Tax=Blastomonas TaxID=150203 RepID=UPI0006B9623B|nr:MULTISPECIES: FliI/YscN family ATPase [Blastomonas]AOG00384.1 ATPase, FliI/YscN family protein [Blastomonas sp. RAC04]KPF74176.1 ATP synthase [Blastomonas sp. AAP25]MCO5791842.1 FliI/YscN family ATPase [Blastomonas sp.]MDK2758968.1 FliI/YscN family ATPase [Blastomonas fulva]